SECPDGEHRRQLEQFAAGDFLELARINSSVHGSFVAMASRRLSGERVTLAPPCQSDSVPVHEIPNVGKSYGGRRRISVTPFAPRTWRIPSHPARSYQTSTSSGRPIAARSIHKRSSVSATVQSPAAEF